MAELKASIVLSAIDKATAPLKGLSRSAGGTQAALAKLGGQASRIGKRRGLRSEVGSLGSKLDVSRKQTAELGREFKKAVDPSEKLRKAFERSQRRTVELARAHKRQKGELRDLSASLRKAGVDTRRLDAEQARLDRTSERLQVKTPLGGMVIRETIFNRSDEYTQVKAGDRIYAGAVFMRIVDTSQMVVRATVNQVDAQTIRVGNRAVVELDAYPGLRFSGHVADMAALASARRGRRSSGRKFIRHIPVRILIEDKDKRILPGFSASADVTVSMGQRGVLVPREALRYEAGQQAGAFVRVAEGGEYRKRRIAVQGLSDTEALIRSGLELGEQVLLTRRPRDQRR